ncbi:MFS transporter [Micromonospora palomenae]|uniref:MFS transporter n=1 Tax=Micromonospora palomenae TaxID=1461247 RepID=UPI00319E0DEC
MRLLRRLALDLTPLRTSRDFRLVFAAAGVSGFGSFITYVTLPYQVYQLTGDPLLVGLLGVCELVPLLLMAFVGGALADYLDRRRLVLGGEIGFTLLCGVLLVNSLSASPHLWLLYVVAAATAALDGVQRPAMEGLTPRIVAPDQIPAAGALNSLRMDVAQLGGPAVAGVLIASVDLAWVYAIDLATFAFSLACLTLVRAVPPPPAADRPSLRSVVTGLRYARSRPELLGTYLVDINAMFFGMPQALYPFMAEKLGGPAVLGLLYAAPAAGSLLATVSSGWVKHVHRHGLMVVLAAGAWGLAVVGFGLSGWLWLALLFLVLAGAADMVSGLFRMTIWNQTIPDHLRGRLAGIEMLSYSTGPLLGQLRSGLVARTPLGVTGSIVSGGVLCVLGTIALAAALPAFLRYDGRDGLARKQAEDAAWSATAPTRVTPDPAPDPAR